MLPYELTKDAEADLEGIFRYTIKEWGEAQTEKYLGKISQGLKNIATRKVSSRTFSEKFPEVLVVRCEHHYIFYLYSESGKPVILAILHERMDMLIRLKERLG